MRVTSQLSHSVVSTTFYNCQFTEMRKIYGLTQKRLSQVRGSGWNVLRKILIANRFMFVIQFILAIITAIRKCFRQCDSEKRLLLCRFVCNAGEARVVTPTGSCSIAANLPICFIAYSQSTMLLPITCKSSLNISSSILRDKTRHGVGFTAWRCSLSQRPTMY